MSAVSSPAVDVVIVGSGPTGAAVARVLAERAPQLEVLMVEAGPTISEPPGAHVKNIADPGERERAQRRSQGPQSDVATVRDPGAVRAGDRRGRPGTFLLERGFQVDGEDGLPVAAMSANVGGMAAHWTGACPRPGGSERIDFLDDLDALLDEAERLLGVTTDAFDASPLGDVVRSRLSAIVDAERAPSARVQRMPLAVHRRDDGRLVWSGSDVVLGDATRQNPRFRLVDETLATRVLVEDGAAVGVIVRDLRSGDEHEVRARAVVVAGDALRTPQLLWASGVRPTALGRYLNDQAQVVFAARILEAAELIERGGGERPGLDEQSGVTWIPYTDDEPFHGQVMQLDASPVPLADDDPVVPGSIVGLGLFCAKDLQADDRVEFSESEHDAYGMPSPTLHYTLTEADRAVIARAEDWIVRLGAAVGEPLGDRPFTMPLGSSLHYQGTTRMGERDDGTSVCSADSEVWGVRNLYVAGNGVIPTATACNPTLTSVALAVRAARRISARLG